MEPVLSRGLAKPRERGLTLRVSPFGLWLICAGLTALAIRLVYILVIAPPPVGLDGDWRFYHSAADLIAHGRFLYRGIFHHAYATAEHPPLYPLLLGAVARLGGTGVQIQRLVGCLVGSGSVVLFGCVGRRIAGFRAGVVAAVLAAVYPPLIVLDGALMSEPLLVFGILCALWLTFSRRPAAAIGAAAGLAAVIALTVLAHTQALLLVPLLVLPAVWGARPGRAWRLLAAGLTVVVVLATWVVRNELAVHRLTLATNDDTVIAGANCRQTYYGADIGWWRLDCDARGRSFAQLVEGDANPAPALRYARAHLTRLPLVALVRIARTFSLFQPLREGNGQIRRKWFDVLGLILFYPILLLAGVGLRRTGFWRWPLVAPILVSVIVSAVGSGLPRLRAPADVSLLLLAAVTLSRVQRQLPAVSSASGSSVSPSSAVGASSDRT